MAKRKRAVSRRDENGPLAIYDAAHRKMPGTKRLCKKYDLGLLSGLQSLWDHRRYDISGRLQLMRQRVELFYRDDGNSRGPLISEKGRA